MITTIVYVKVKAESVEAFKTASLANSRASSQEEGNLRFDVLQNDEDSSCFVLYEAYENKAQALRHKETSHYALWRETVAGMMAEPRKGVTYTHA
jgi:autoinducer 2-degrading protein